MAGVLVSQLNRNPQEATMQRALIVVFICVLVGTAPIWSLGQPTAPAGPRPTFATTKVDGADNVYVFRYGNHQSMFVTTSEGVIATDPIGYGRPQAVKTYV